MFDGWRDTASGKGTRRAGLVSLNIPVLLHAIGDESRAVGIFVGGTVPDAIFRASLLFLAIGADFGARRGRIAWPHGESR